MTQLEVLTAKESQLFFNTYIRLKIHIERGEGCYLYTSNGDKILDMFGGLAVNLLGYCHPSATKAINEQINKYNHISNLFYQDKQIELAEKLINTTGYSKVFFSNSGTEAIEGALKLVRKYFHGSQKQNIFAFTGSYHGRSYGALSLTSREKYRIPFEPLLPGIHHLKYNDAELLYKNVNAETAAVFLEFIQGEGGVNEANIDFIRALNDLRDKYEFLLIADEIQTGLGRTGKFLAKEWYEIKPDVTVIAKGIGGGLPLGAILGSEKVTNVFEPGLHGSTCGGNPVACAAGIAVINELEKGLIENAQIVGDYLITKLKKLQSQNKDILEIRGKGLMVGIQFNYPVVNIVEKMLSEGVLINATNENVIRLLPPLILTKEDVDLFIEKFKTVLTWHNIFMRNPI